MNRTIINHLVQNSCTRIAVVRLFSSTPSKIQPTIDQSKSERIIKYESAVYRSFFGELDADYLQFPKLVADSHESHKIQRQFEMIKQNFGKWSADSTILNQIGFNDLSSMTQVEKSVIFEAIGSSLEVKTLNDESLTSQLITMDQFSLTDRFIEQYQQRKKFIQILVPILIRNSVIINTIQHSSNESLKQKLLDNFSQTKLALAFDEPNDHFMSAPYPFWQSSAVFDANTNHWRLKGQKTQIWAEDSFDYWLTFCKVANENSSDYGIGAFLLKNESDLFQIESDGRDNFGNQFQKITFDLNVPKENVEIIVDSNATLLLNMKATGHLLTSAVLLGIMKQLQSNIIDYYQQQNINHSLMIRKNSSFITEQIKQFTEMIYTLESCLYLTNSHFDTFELREIDLYLQSMIVKITTVEYVQQMLKSLRLLFTTKQIPFVCWQDVNDVVNVLEAFMGSTTSTRMLLASYGLRAIGQWRYDHILKLRLNRIYPLHYLKNQYDRFRRRSNQRYDGALDGIKSLKQLDSRLKKSADLLVQALDIQTETGNHILKIYGKECIQNQIDMNRFCTMTIDTFEMLAVLSRTNHGLRFDLPSASDQTIGLCNNICENKFKQIKYLKSLVEGVLEISEERRSQIIHQSNMRFDGYFARPTFDRVV